MIMQFIAVHRLPYSLELQPSSSPCQAFCGLCPTECDVWSTMLIWEDGNSEQWIGSTVGGEGVGETWAISRGCEKPWNC